MNTHMDIATVSTLFLSVAVFLFVISCLTLAIVLIKKKFASKEKCTIRINEDPEMTKKVPMGTTLLAALTKEGISIPSSCGGKATCKQCRVRIMKGAEEPLETDKGTFSKRQLKDGWRLSCQTKLHDDVHIHIPEELINVKEWKAKVVSNKNVATFIKELEIELEGDEAMPYKSGGYAQIAIPPYETSTEEWKETIDPIYWDDWDTFGMWNRKIDFRKLAKGGVQRAYSMASYPEEGKKLLFNVRIASPPLQDGKVADSIPWGIGSSYLFSLKPGDEITLQGPYGESFMIDDERDLYFLIGGAGSSFARAHILHLFYTEKTDRAISLWYGARALRENIYQKEFEHLEKTYPNFNYHLVLSEPQEEDVEKGWPLKDPLKTNFLFRAFEEGQLKEMKAPEEALYYVCGPPMHNKSVMKLLDDWGVPKENIVFDDYCST